MLRRIITTLALCAVAALAAAGPASARTAHTFVGVVDDILIDLPSADRAQALTGQSLIGVGTLRQQFDWARIERSRGSYTLTEYDNVVAEAAVRHIRVMPVLSHAPRFRSSRPKHGAHRGLYPPKHNADMAAFARVLVRRYGPTGTLWQDRPDLPRMPIHSWQIWNEPNVRVYWASGPSPKKFTRMLRVVGKAIKAEDPKSEIVTGGLPESNLGVPFERFVRGIYRAGGKSAFDTLGLHAYSRTARGTVGAAQLARRLMNRNHDRRGKLWITEVGWASGGPRSSFRVGRKGQAKRVRDILLRLAKRRKSLRLRGVVYYKWRDTERGAGGHDFFGLHTGLVSASGKPKPAFYTFKRVANQLTR